METTGWLRIFLSSQYLSFFDKLNKRCVSLYIFFVFPEFFKTLTKVLIKNIFTAMLTFDEYYGYKNKDKKVFQNNLQRSQKSSSRQRSSQHKKPRRKKNMSGEYINPQQSHKSFQGSFRRSRKTLKSNPFKSLKPRQNERQKKVFSVQKSQNIASEVKHFVDRFERQNCSHSRQQTVEMKDSLILKFLEKRNLKKEKEQQRRNSAAYKKKKISSLSNKKMIVPKMGSSKKICTNIPHGYSKISKQIKNPDTQQRKTEKKLKEEISTVSVKYSKTKSNTQPAESCNQKPKQSKKKQKYPYKQTDDKQKNKKAGKQAKKMERKIPELKRMESFGQSSLIFTIKHGQTVEGKCKIHYEQLRNLLKYVDEKISEEKLLEKHSFERLFYFCRKLYLKQVKKMKQCLEGKQNSENCFILQKSKITQEEINKYRFSENATIEKQIEHLSQELKVLEGALRQESIKLIEKDQNDPYLRLQVLNFETELINQIFDEINFINEKLPRIQPKKKEGLLKRRKDAILLMVMIAELSKFKKETQKFIPVENLNQIFDDNIEALDEILEKFQQMPL